jgi:hypothetical protein
MFFSTVIPGWVVAFQLMKAPLIRKSSSSDQDPLDFAAVTTMALRQSL